jgi:GxxExxY protein
MTGRNSNSVPDRSFGRKLVVVEVKCVEAIHPVYEAQLLSYLRLSGKHVGLLINFYVAHLKDGIKRMVDGKDWDR